MALPLLCRGSVKPTHELCKASIIHKFNSLVSGTLTDKNFATSFKRISYKLLIIHSSFMYQSIHSSKEAAYIVYKITSYIQITKGGPVCIVIY